MTKQNKTEETFQPLDITEDRTPEQIQADIDYTTQALSFLEEAQEINSALQPFDASLPLVEGLQFPPNMVALERLQMIQNIETYTGATPVKISGTLANSWIRVLGCCVMPIRVKVDGETIDSKTGEVTDSFEVKYVPLFKLEEKNRDGEHTILTGGGKNGLTFARLRVNLFGPGDWDHVEEVKFNSEAREGTNSEGKKEPRILYRVEGRRAI